MTILEANASNPFKIEALNNTRKNFSKASDNSSKRKVKKLTTEKNVGDTRKVGDIKLRFKTLILIITSMMVTSCMQQSGGTGNKTNKIVSTASKGGAAPTFSSSLNSLQNGSVQSSGSLNLQTNFTDAIYLRGEEINRYITNGNTSQTQCIVANFSLSGATKRALVIAALPQSFYNFTTQVTEYYYLLAPGNKNQNEDFCKKAGLITALSNLYPGSTNAYALMDICPNCLDSLYVSDYFRTYSSTGGIISNINVSYLTLRVNSLGLSTSNSGTSCSATNECKSLGYDCCSLGQCIKDKELKEGVNTNSQEYIDALAAIAIEANSINNYPNFYYLCGGAPSKDPEIPPSGPINAELDAQKRFAKLKDLYDCTALIDGEVSICSKTYNQAGNGIEFNTGIDDRNFTTNYLGTRTLVGHSIYEIIHADETLYKNETTLVGASFTIGTGNDNLTDATKITLNHTPSPAASNRDLKIRYKVDGSCKLVNSDLATCDKYYIQGNNTKSAMDHYPASRQFAIPTYADMTRSFKVEVDNIVRSQENDWKITFGLSNNIEFIDAKLKVADFQKVKITYYVDIKNGYPTLMTSKASALNEINTMCSCAGISCSLTPVTEARNGSNVITNYSCVYPAPELPEPPLQQTVYISSKTAPVRFFEASGVSQSVIVGTSMVQEQSGDKPFQYEGGNSLRPNNRNLNIGFDEIYGSLSNATGAAQPAKEIRVVKGRNYDLFVDTGAYSTCINCGNDYWSSVTRLFPQSFLYKGGGILPSISSTNRTLAGEFRADDLLFGRACYVPATMIPWSNRPNYDRQLQRKNRMRAQHFMYANGYQRDWYGFDIGSVIGSFDGINWFSVGSQRRIKATTNRMWVAINAPFADLTADSSYKVTVSDASTAPFSGSFVTANYDSDGAQCQKYHVCNNDQDCATQLGWDYVCQNVTDIYTAWPQIDSNGDEIPGSGGSGSDLRVSLAALFGPVGNGGTKRCIYRGRGTPCTKDYTKFSVANAVSIDKAFNGSISLRTHACSNNNYCQELKTGAVFNPYFNNKISRFAKSVTAQNADSIISPGDLDSFGMGARILGRPYEYNGKQSLDVTSAPQFSANNIEGLCIPGKFATQGETFVSAHSKKPATDADYNGDQVLGIGMTQSNPSINPAYLSSCPAFDELTKNNVAYAIAGPTINANTLNSSLALLKLSASQNITTNALDIFSSTIGKDLTANFSNNQVTTPTYQEHRCLRAPGAACFTDQDCAPNYLASKNISTLTSLTTSALPTEVILNDYELKFWQEDLVCGQKESKSSASYLLKNNRCCRENSKNITLPTLEEGNLTLDTKRIGFIKVDKAISSEIALSDKDRISRISPALYKMNNDTLNYPALANTTANTCTGGTCKDRTKLIKQYNTLHEVLGKTCCSGNWIREFHDTNGKGHRWDSVKQQKFDKRNFACLNWAVDTVHPSNYGRTCVGSTAPDDPDCFAKETKDPEAAVLFELLSGMELLGVPQITLPSSTTLNTDAKYKILRCNISPINGGTTSIDGSDFPLPGTTIYSVSTAAANTHEYIQGSEYYYSATDLNNFSKLDNSEGRFSQAKMIFSDSQFACCTPAGQAPPAGSTDDACCTGFKNPQNGLCQLKDYTNVSVYFNRYISSAAKDLNPGLINSQTGFIENINDVEQLLVLLDVCASGTYARGVALADLKVPGHESDEYSIRRFVDKAGEAKGFSELFDAGLHWNTNVYCFPRATGGSTSSGISTQYR